MAIVRCLKLVKDRTEKKEVARMLNKEVLIVLNFKFKLKKLKTNI